jgi:glycosyltransferase involved in cell wall biosynthesis
MAKIEDKISAVHTLEAAHKADPSTINEMRGIINQVEPNIVHTHMPYADLFGGVAAKLAGQVPVISTRHHDCLTSWTDWLRFASYYAVAGNFLDALIAVSEQVASQAKSYERWSESDIHVVHHGCRDEQLSRDTSRQEICSSLGIPESCAIILSVGRLLKWKGHEYAVRALEHLRNEKEIHWLIAGNGPQRNFLHSLASELGVTDSLHLLGHRDDVPRLMSAADILVHPSTSEAFGIVVIEAMMQGTPVVGSRAGAMPEVIDHGETGYLVEPADGEAISCAVHRYLQDPRKQMKMQNAARKEYLQDYTLEEMICNTIKVYQNIV